MSTVWNAILTFGLWDVDLLVEIQQRIGPEWEPAWQAISFLGDSRLTLILVMALFWYTLNHRPYQVLAAILIGSSLSSLLKLIVDHPRPEDAELLIHAATTSPSFPSGHVVMATVFWGTLAWYRMIPIWVPIVITPLVMFSRMYLGMHFLGDVIVGLLLGAAWLVLYHRVVSPLIEQIQIERLARYVAVFLVGSVLVLPISSAFPFGWEILGALAGAGFALIVQERVVGFNPRPVALSWQITKFVIGAAGIVLVVLVDFTIQRELLLVEVAVYSAAAVWGLLAAPYVFERLGLGQHSPTGTPA